MVRTVLRFSRFPAPRSRPAIAGLLFLAALAGCAAPAHAQAVYGSIAGTIEDPSGVPVPGVNVSITSVERKTVDAVTTNGSGFYAKERLLPGLYDVRVEASGFKSATATAVRVGIDAQTKIDVTLELGAMTEALEVIGSSEGLKTDRADVSTTFETREMTELPVGLDRNFTKFLLLTPGTQQLGWQHAASENPQGSTQIMVNGQHFSGTGYQLDGTENRDPILGIIVINPTLESITETKVTSQNYDAEFGQATAGVVSVQTKSGANDFHGSAFEFYQSDRFQARNPYTQPKDRDLPETSKHQFGASLGGPIRENKFFFFGDFQGVQSTVGGSRRLTVPTDRARTGDLSEYGFNIYDPATGDPSQRVQFPGNIIPSNRLSPQALAILDLLPRANQPGLRDNYVASGSEPFDSKAFNVRLDGRLNPNLNTFARYSFADFTRDGPTSFGEGGGQALVSLGGKSKVRNQSLALGADYTFNPTTVLDVRFGAFNYKVNVQPFDFGTTPAQDAGIPGLNLDDFSSGLPALYIEGQYGFNMGSGLNVNQCNCPLEQNEKQFQLVSNLTKVLGAHTLKAGIDIRRAHNLRVPSDSHRAGELNFGPDRTRGADGGGFGFATFLLGDVTHFKRYVSPTTDAREQQWRHFYYMQDTWRAHAKLTLNYGLRLEVINPQTVNEPGNGGFLDQQSGDILVAGVGGIPMNGGVKNKMHWEPRLGATYQLNEKTVLRGGYGRSTDIGVFGSTFGHSVTQNLPVLAIQEMNAPTNFGSVFNLAQGPTAPEFPEVPANGRLRLPNGVNAFVLNFEMKLPTLDAFNLSLQRQLNEAMSLEVGYVGNRGKNVFAGDGPDVNNNEPTLEGFAQGVPTDLRRPFFAGPVGGYGGAFGWTQGFRYFCNCAENSYDSLQTQLTKRFSKGYSFRASYTLQRVRQQGGSQLFFLPDLERGRPDWDRVHNVALTALYELPFFRDHRFLGNWQVNATATIQSGLPFNVTYANAGADRDVGPNRPDLVGDPQFGSGDGITKPYFNVTPIGTAGSAFGQPEIGTFGNLKRNAASGPGYWRVDASLFKRIPLKGSAAVELRLEAVNVLNHVNRGNPDAEIGTPGNPRTNAGMINNTAYSGNDPQRNVQLGMRLQF